VTQREKRSLELYKDHRSLFVDYEDLVADTDTYMARHQVQKFLEVKVTPLTSKTQKIITDNKQLVTNLEEVLEYFSSTEFSERIQ
jgi:hypothetical protein